MVIFIASNCIKVLTVLIHAHRFKVDESTKLTTESEHLMIKLQRQEIFSRSIHSYNRRHNSFVNLLLSPYSIGSHIYSIGNIEFLHFIYTK